MPLGASVSRRLIAQGAVQSLGVIGLPPLLDQQARLAQIREPFSVHALVTQLSVKAFHAAFGCTAPGKRMSVPQRLRRSQRFAPIEPATPLSNRGTGGPGQRSEETRAYDCSGQRH